ncbi:MAG TPA: ABC transporter permease [Nocardioidaceae bacterium]|nr:ABC transporter permease [Nocardioidaceae bacterium]
MSPLAAATPEVDWRLGVVLVVLVGIAATTSRVAEIGVERDQITAAVRAVAQLAVVALVLTAVLDQLGLTFAFVALMFVVATATSTRRVGVRPAEARWIAAAIAAGAVPVVGLVLASGVIPFNGVGIIPIAGIVIGNAMTAATLSGRRAFAELAAQRGAYEAGLALGLQQHESARLVVQPSAKEALLPGLDQTRTVGLVTLPGAFVGVILGGGTPLEAGAAQVLVLVGLLAAQAVTTACTLQLIAHGKLSHRDR